VANLGIGDQIASARVVDHLVDIDGDAPVRMHQRDGGLDITCVERLVRPGTRSQNQLGLWHPRNVPRADQARAVRPSPSAGADRFVVIAEDLGKHVFLLGSRVAEQRCLSDVPPRSRRI
jgi:hypothetical protein